MHDIIDPRHHMVDYVEFASADPHAMCAFLEATLGWNFDWLGPGYVAFHGAGLEGGLYRANMASRSADGGALKVFKAVTFSRAKRWFCPTGRAS